MTATVTKLATAKRKPVVATKQARKPATPSRATKWEARTGYLLGGLATTVLALSLEHLATGFSEATHLPLWQGSIMATAVDVGFVAVELMPFTCREATLADTKYTRLALAAAVYCASAAFNAIAFAHGGPVTALSCLLGASVPAMVGTFLHLANRCLIGRSK